MKTANLSEVKDQLSAYVDMVRGGERVRILVRGVAAADLVPVTLEAGDDDAWLADLERRGVVRRGIGSIEEDLLEPGPPVAGSPSDDLIAERRGR
jgi:antitoxin (DNA-binding transcriptional repressor) of toxin-antitoxin stability system